MANTVTKTVIHNGDKNYVVLVNIVGDGSGELTDTTVAAASAIGTAATILRVNYAMTGFSAALEWDATTDVQAVAIREDNHDFCFHEFGGVPNFATTGKTGNLFLTTTGLGNGDKGTILVHLRKS